MNYAAYNEKGIIIGFYSDDIHETNQIPKNVIPISDDDWQTFLNDQGCFVVNLEKLELEPAPPPTQDELDQRHNWEIMNQIEQVEKKYAPNMFRTLREAALGEPEAVERLRKINVEVAELRKELK